MNTDKQVDALLLYPLRQAIHQPRSEEGIGWPGREQNLESYAAQASDSDPKAPFYG